MGEGLRQSTAFCTCIARTEGTPPKYANKVVYTKMRCF